MFRWKKSSGFTIVELLLVIVIIGILAGIVIVSYGSITRNTRVSIVKDNLTSAAKAMEIFNIKNKYYPPSLADAENFKVSKGVSVEVKSSIYPHYSSLTTVQSGALFYQVCEDLLNEGIGKAENLGGGIDVYIESCNVYNDNAMEIHGWDSKTFNTPLSEATLTSYIASVPEGDAWHPNQQSAVKEFYTELRDRYVSQGGAYPVESFWDSWANPGNGGTIKEDLPEPDSTDTTTYCVEAKHLQDSSIIWHTTVGNKLAEGPCST